MRRIILVALVLCMAAAGLFFGLRSSAPDTPVTQVSDLGLLLVDDEAGVAVLGVRDGSIAARAGVQPGDVLLEANGETCDASATLEQLLASAPVQLRLHVQRNQDEVLTLLLDLR